MTSSPMEPTDVDSVVKDLRERVARLEAEVAWLAQMQAGGTRPAKDGATSPTSPVPGNQVLPAPARKSPAAPAWRPSPVVWIASTGAMLFLGGVVFFFRWAIQQGWIGPAARVLLGLIAGAGLTAYGSRRLLGGHRRLGVALLVAGLGTLHFSFRVGAVEYHLYPPVVGLVAMALVTLGAGALSTRAGSAGALTVSIVSGLVAPLLFQEGARQEVALAAYLAVLMAASIAALYWSAGAATWHLARWTAVIGVWLLLLAASANVSRNEAPFLGLLLLVHLVLAGVWTWLPGRSEIPGTASALWIVAMLCCTLAGWLVWTRAGLSDESFAFPVFAAAGVSLGLVLPLRRRMGGALADWGLMSLFVGYLALGVPIASGWRWVGAFWGVFATTLAWASPRSDRVATSPDGRLLARLAAAMALLATLRWSRDGTFGFSTLGGGVPFLNESFAAGALASCAWFLLMNRGNGLAVVSFMALQFTASLSLAFEGARVLDWFHPPLELSPGPSHAASIVITLVWAISGASQWMWGLPQENRAQRGVLAAGYVWMAFASLKLIGSDLAQADTPLRALAFLGVGSIGMAAAVLASRRRSRNVSS